MRGAVFVSDSLPRMELVPGEDLAYLGAHPFRIQDLASGERHVFVDSAGGKARRMLVLQFEGILPSSDEIYRYPITNPVEFGGIRFRESAHAYRLSDVLHEQPQGELAGAVRFLESKGLRLEDAQAMARFATIVGDDRKHEFLIFLHEAGSDTAAVSAHARSAFTIR